MNCCEIKKGFLSAFLQKCPLVPVTHQNIIEGLYFYTLPNDPVVYDKYGNDVEDWVGERSCIRYFCDIYGEDGWEIMTPIDQMYDTPLFGDDNTPLSPIYAKLINLRRRGGLMIEYLTCSDFSGIVVPNKSNDGKIGCDTPLTVGNAKLTLASVYGRMMYQSDTNASMIRAMTDEELAKSRVDQINMYCGKSDLMYIGDFTGIASTEEEAIQKELEWLHSKPNNCNDTGSVPEDKETKLAFKIADRFISIHAIDGGYDYSIMGEDYKEIDGGVYDRSDISIRGALKDIVEDLKGSSCDNGTKGVISNEDELIPIDYDELYEKVESAKHNT